VLSDLSSGGGALRVEGSTQRTRGCGTVQPRDRLPYRPERSSPRVQGRRCDQGSHLHNDPSTNDDSGRPALGLETFDSVIAAAGGVLHVLDRVVVVVFVTELVLRPYAKGPRFFRDPWSVFDLGVVTLSLLPATGGLSVLRALRILRALRLSTAAGRRGRQRGARGLMSPHAPAIYETGMSASPLEGVLDVTSSVLHVLTGLLHA